MTVVILLKKSTHKLTRNDPSSWRQKQLFRVGFYEAIILLYENLDLGPWMNLIIDSLITWSEFLQAIFSNKK